MAEDDPRIRVCTQLIWTYVALFVASWLIYAVAYVPIVWQRFFDDIKLLVPIGFLVLYRLILRRQGRGRCWTFYVLAFWQSIYTTDPIGGRFGSAGRRTWQMDFYQDMHALSDMLFMLSAWLLLIPAVVIVRMPIFPLRKVDRLPKHGPKMG